MKPTEYAALDGVALAELVARGEVSAAELADTARAAIDAVNPRLNAVIGRIDAVAEEALTRGPKNAPFSGVPFLIKDIGMHYANIPHEMGSRFAEGLAVRERGAESRGGGAHGVLPLPPRSFAIRAGKFWMMTIRDAWLKPTIAKVWPSGDTS